MNYSKYYEEEVIVEADPATVFAYADDHRNFSSHMNKSSWMMGGGSMRAETDEGNGQVIGSHIKMTGKVFGFNLFLDEVIVEYYPPVRKVWETTGKINLVVIDHYKLGFEIEPLGDKSKLKVFINYNLPKSNKTKILGQLLSGVYAAWCVNQMAEGITKRFELK